MMVGSGFIVSPVMSTKHQASTIFSKTGKQFWCLAGLVLEFCRPCALGVVNINFLLTASTKFMTFGAKRRVRGAQYPPLIGSQLLSPSPRPVTGLQSSSGRREVK